MKQTKVDIFEMRPLCKNQVSQAFIPNLIEVYYQYAYLGQDTRIEASCFG